jgi:hypothetical protein
MNSVSMRSWAAGRLPPSSPFTAAFLWLFTRRPTLQEPVRPWTSSQLLSNADANVRSPSQLRNGAFQGYQYMSPAGYSNTSELEPLAIAQLQGPQTGAGYTDTDIGLLKNFHLTESKYFQFRGDFLNAFNNVQLGHPNTNSLVQPSD